MWRDHSLLPQAAGGTFSLNVLPFARLGSLRFPQRGLDDEDRFSWRPNSLTEGISEGIFSFSGRASRAFDAS
jgi:hypothetical protein